MKAIVFKTPGELDFRAMLISGLSAKPKSANPIGFFGTGLKYAIAVLCRLEVKVKLCIGDKEYVFYTKKGTFRDKEFDFIKVKQRGGLHLPWKYTDLPFTTELGKNWELWQAFRELEANTRDENGITYEVNTDDRAESGFTKFIIYGDKFANVWANRDTVFLAKEAQLLERNGNIEVYNQMSDYLYYRGLRVVKLKKPSIYTYNILYGLELTEDRTIKYMWAADNIIAQFVSAQATNEQLVSNIVGIPAIPGGEEKFYEASLDWDNLYTAPSDLFKRIVHKHRATKTPYLNRINTYYDRYTIPEDIVDEESLVKKVQWWLDSGELSGYPTLVELLKKEVIPFILEHE